MAQRRLSARAYSKRIGQPESKEDDKEHDDDFEAEVDRQMLVAQFSARRHSSKTSSNAGDKILEGTGEHFIVGGNVLKFPVSSPPFLFLV